MPPPAVSRSKSRPLRPPVSKAKEASTWVISPIAPSATSSRTRTVWGRKRYMYASSRTLSERAARSSSDLVARQHLRVVADQARGLQRELVGEGARPLGGAAADGDQHAVPRGGQLGGEAAGDRAGTQDGPAERCGGSAHGDVVVLHRWG